MLLYYVEFVLMHDQLCGSGVWCYIHVDYTHSCNLYIPTCTHTHTHTPGICYDIHTHTHTHSQEIKKQEAS